MLTQGVALWGSGLGCHRSASSSPGCPASDPGPANTPREALGPAPTGVAGREVQAPGFSLAQPFWVASQQLDALFPCFSVTLPFNSAAAIAAQEPCGSRCTQRSPEVAQLSCSHCGIPDTTRGLAVDGGQACAALRASAEAAQWHPGWPGQRAGASGPGQSQAPRPPGQGFVLQPGEGTLPL